MLSLIVTLARAGIVYIPVGDPTMAAGKAPAGYGIRVAEERIIDVAMVAGLREPSFRLLLAFLNLEPSIPAVPREQDLPALTQSFLQSRYALDAERMVISGLSAGCWVTDDGRRAKRSF